MINLKIASSSQIEFCSIACIDCGCVWNVSLQKGGKFLVKIKLIETSLTNEPNT